MAIARSPPRFWSFSIEAGGQGGGSLSHFTTREGRVRFALCDRLPDRAKLVLGVDQRCTQQVGQQVGEQAPLVGIDQTTSGPSGREGKGRVSRKRTNARRPPCARTFENRNPFLVDDAPRMACNARNVSAFASNPDGREPA